jgi:hypothetical protein
MKKTLLIFALFCAHICFAQTNPKIDTSNYYNSFSPKNLKGSRLTTNWLRLDDVVPVILDEFEKAGYDWLYDRTIYKLENGQHIKISAYSRKNNIGFLYMEGHNMFPSKTDRSILFQKDNSQVNYTQCEETYSGEADFVAIKKIPNNIFVLKEDCYFFQYTDNIEDNKVLVTKEIAIAILRQDIRRYLATAPKPKE